MSENTCAHWMEIRARRACIMEFKGTMRPCKLCGLDLDLVGKSHRCIPRVANTVPVVGDVANAMANSATTYRYRDVAKRRTYMRDLMRRRRAS
jgi:hypothetical protein